MKLPIGKPVIDVISIGYQTNLPVLLEGRHGCGKSAVFVAAAMQLGIDVIVRDLSLMEPPDLIGIPQVAPDGRTHYAPPSFLPEDGRGLLVIEELNRSPAYMRNSCLVLLTERRLNDYVLPDGWVPMAAINPATDGYLDAAELDMALKSRFVHLEVEPSVDEWSRWAKEKAVHPKIVEFVEQSPGVFDPHETCPRSWTYAANLLTTYEASGALDENVLAASLSGVLGETWALAFLEFYKNNCKSLTARDIIEHYPSHRASLKGWVAKAKLDAVAASLETLKRHLQPQRNYSDVIGDPKKKKHVESFFADLPPDLKRQLSTWLASSHEVVVVEFDAKVQRVRN